MSVVSVSTLVLADDDGDRMVIESHGESMLFKVHAKDVVSGREDVEAMVEFMQSWLKKGTFPVEAKEDESKVIGFSRMKEVE